MKYRPILYCGSMVRALLDGSKTQTRRIVKPQPHEGGRPEYWSISELPQFCPYGQPGDRLWVRETFFAYGRWETRFSAKKGRDEWHFVDMTQECVRQYGYPATGPRGVAHKRDSGITPTWWKRPAIFMPRWASRITLEITGVRVKRLQNISEADAIAEGIEPQADGIGWKRGPISGDHPNTAKRTAFPKLAYQSLWESINGPSSWNANPWVWVIEFKRVTS